MRKVMIFALSVLLVAVSACGPAKKVPQATRPAPLSLHFQVLRNPRTNSYVDLDYGIKLNTYDARNKKEIITRYEADLIFVPAVSTYPAVLDFMRESGKRYMKELGFSMNADIETDYLLSLYLTEMNLSWFANTGWVADVSAEVTVSDADNHAVYPRTAVSGRFTQYASGADYAAANQAMNEAYTRLLEDVDWDRIAYFLKKASRASNEKNKKVAGTGNTALESTVINWFVQSSPKGADVTFRIVSSTPDVKNSNFKYIGTTPFESTETFDIIGLTYNNSGNVQIEVSCEKTGYITQRKRFNLRSVIDQKEISTKFNLVKED